MVIGLTGPTGAGKSTVANVAAECGYKVINCDELAHAVTAAGEPLAALIKAFGKGILFKDGTLNRHALTEHAFVDKAHTQLLNNTVFPFILDEIRRRLDGLAGHNVLLDAPTLYESGADAFCDKVVALLCDRAIRVERIIKRDNLSTFHALLRISAGQPDAFYRERADIIIENNDTEAKLAETARSVFEKERL